MIKYIFLIISFSYVMIANEICIENFSKKLCGDFRVLDSVIVKTTLRKNILKKKLNKPMKQIAFLGIENLFLIQVEHPLEYAKKLNKEKYIIYAQPNISQRREQSNSRVQQNIYRYDLAKMWKQTKGAGVNIAIIDDGFDLDHEDLQGIHLRFSYDVNTKSLNSDPQERLDIHGTQVAGVIFAQHNNKGIDGIAPDANLIAIRQTTNITSDTVLSFTIADKAGAHIINCSWNSPILLEPVYDMIKFLSKKIAIVISAGNSHKEIEPFSTEASIPEVITVGATQAYSNYGDIVDFQIKSGIMSLRAGKGYRRFGGTSAAAAVISGLIALEMSKNKSLSISRIVDHLKEILGEQKSGKTVQ